MSNKKLFPGSVMAIPTATGMASQGLIVNAAQPKHRKEIMNLHFSLAVPEAAHQELEARVAKGDIVPVTEQNAKYGADLAQTRNLVNWLKKEGFRILQQTDDGTSVYASAPVSQVEASLGVHMVRVTSRGQTYTAASDVPSLPADIAASVQHIGGLQPFVHAHKHFRMGTARLSAVGAPSPDAPPYTASAILSAYNAEGLGLSGAGQEIGILIDTVPVPGDLTLFWQM